MPTAPNIDPIERAFELAKSGRYRTTADIQQRLRTEGYSASTVIGPYLLKQLRLAIHEANTGTRSGE